MFDTFTIPQILALLLGLYMLAAGIGLFTDSDGYAKVLEDFKTNVALTYLAGIMAFMIGALIVVLHNLWSSPAEVIISLIGWAAAIEGLLMLAFRRPFISIISAIPMTTSVLRGYGIFIIVLGAILLFFGLK